MTRYGKLIDGELRFAPNPLVEGGKHVFTNDPEIYAEQGWFPIVYTPAPECGENEYPESSWQEQNGEIVRIWQIVTIDTDGGDSP